MESLDALTYFLLNLGLHNLILVAGGLLLGMAMAYFVWGRAKLGTDELQAREHEADRRAQDAELSLAKVKEEFRAYRKSAESGAATAGPDPGREEKLEKLAGEKEKLDEELKTTTAKWKEVEGALNSLRKDKLELENRLSAKTSSRGPSREEFKKVRDEKRAVEKEFRKATREWERKLAGHEAGERKATGELETLRGRIQELESKREDSEKDAAGKLERLVAEKKELQGRLDKAEAEIREKRSKRSKAEDEEREKTRKELASLRKDKEQLASGLKAARDEAAEAEGLRKDKADLSEKLKAAENDRSRIRKDLESRSAELEAARASLEEEARKQKDEIEQLREEKSELTNQLAKLGSGEDAAKGRVGQLLAEMEALEERLREEEHERTEVDRASAVLRQELYGLRKQLEAADERGDNVEELEKELAAAEEKLFRTQEQLVRENRRRVEIEERLELLGGNHMESGEGGDAPEEGDPPGRDPMIRVDPLLGEVYEQPPVRIDDLTEIKGIGKVIEKRLHESGIYTYRQIGQWNDAQIGEFSERLDLPEKTVHGDWREQARELHARKYDDGKDPG